MQLACKLEVLCTPGQQYWSQTMHSHRTLHVTGVPHKVRYEQVMYARFQQVWVTVQQYTDTHQDVRPRHMPCRFNMPPRFMPD